jgi:hypothetical protein
MVAFTEIPERELRAKVEITGLQTLLQSDMVKVAFTEIPERELRVISNISV